MLHDDLCTLSRVLVFENSDIILDSIIVPKRILQHHVGWESSHKSSGLSQRLPSAECNLENCRLNDRNGHMGSPFLLYILASSTISSGVLADQMGTNQF